MWELIFGIILGFLIYCKIIKPTQFWEDKQINHLPSWPLIGNMGSLFAGKKHFLEIINDIYNKFPNERYVGYVQFTTPSLLIRDLDLIKKISVKEFDSFHDHMGLFKVDTDPLLSKSLIHLHGDQWKEMRATLSPAFTSSKMRNMYHLMAECTKNFFKHFQNKEQVNVEMKELLARFANDVIATTAFGIRVNSLDEPKNDFYTMEQKLTEFSLMQGLKILFLMVAPELAKVLKIKMLRQDVAQFFTSVITSNISKRIKNKIVRPDLIHLLLEARRGRLKHDSSLEEKGEGFATVEESHIGKSNLKMELTDDHIVAQALLFFFAGFETVSNVSSLLAYELTVNPDVQRKLQNEIDTVRQEYPGVVPYDILLSMKYLDQVVSETLRKWPPGFQTDRLCNKDFLVPPTSTKERTFVIEKGMVAIVPIMAIHHDRRYFPDPERFDPERFNEENKLKIVPGSYMPFGLGPRNCIGSRYALLEIKTLFLHLLSKFDIVPNEKTEIPFKISPTKPNIVPEKGFQLGLKPRQFV